VAPRDDSGGPAGTGPGGRRPSGWGGGPGPGPIDGRTIAPRRTLPGTRAVVGGLVIAVAAVLTFWAYDRSARSPHQLYVVAAHDLEVGQRISAADLGLVTLNIPDARLRGQVFGAPSSLIGASVISPVDAGALVEASEVVGRGGPPGSAELSLDIALSRAVGGTLKRGEFVDVLATFGSGGGSYTTTVASHIEILDATVDADSVSGSTELFIFAVPDPATAEALANADIAAAITLVRSVDRTTGGPTTTAPPYAAPAPPGVGSSAGPATGTSGS
jgi:Flp pilus assembly protein CpaB